MAKAKESETRAQQLARHMEGRVTAWPEQPLDTRSHTPSQGDVEPPRYRPFPAKQDG